MTSLSDATLPDNDTARGAAIRFCGYIKDDREVAMHVKRLYGMDMPLKQIASLRRDHATPTRHQRSMADATPLPSDIWLDRREARLANERFRIGLERAGR